MRHLPVPPGSRPRRMLRRTVTVAAAATLITALVTPVATAAPTAPAVVDAPSGAAAALITPADGDPPSGMPTGRRQYRTLADYNGDMAALAAAHPATVKSITLPHQSRQGRDVYGIEVTHDVQAADGKPVLFMMGMHHGNEWPSGEHTIEFAYDLVGNDGVDPQITRLLDQVRVIFVPVVNVDGFVLNRRTSCGLSPTCVSNQGVDINRNYPFGWGSNAGSNATTRGPGPGSEPEVQNVMELTAGNQVTVLITNHTSGHTVLRPPLEKRAGDTPDEARYAALTDAITAENGYTGMKSGFDYETTGETPDWSYYATRGLGFTFEIMKTQSTVNTYQEVIDDYLGIGKYPGKSNRAAFLVALRYAADPAGHSVIHGTAPTGAVLTLTKDFDLYTAPIKQAGGVIDPPKAIPTHLQSSLVVGQGGSFDWHVNPSVRPTPAYTTDGVFATGPGTFLRESWTLTCARPGGEVLQTVSVTVDLGERADVDLQQCQRTFGDGHQVIQASTVGGALTLSTGSAPVVMPAVVITGLDQLVNGSLNRTSVTDARGTSAGWDLTGQVSDFTGPGGTILADNLGWAPAASAIIGSLPLDPRRAPSVLGGPTIEGRAIGAGLATSQTLCRAPAGHSAGVFGCDAALTLGIPGSAGAGAYSAILTLTLI